MAGGLACNKVSKNDLMQRRQDAKLNKKMQGKNIFLGGLCGFACE
jgi:hypothetical protein